MDTKAQPCFAPGCVLARGEEPGNGATSAVGVWSAPLAAHRCTGSAMDEQETEAEVPLLGVLSFACCFLQQHTRMKLSERVHCEFCCIRRSLWQPAVTPHTCKQRGDC